MANKEKDLKKAKEVTDAVSSSINSLDSFSRFVEEKLEEEIAQKKAKPNVK